MDGVQKEKGTRRQRKNRCSIIGQDGKVTRDQTCFALCRLLLFIDSFFLLKGTYEINADSGNVRFGVCVISKSKEQTRFTNAGVSDKEEFEQVIAVAESYVCGDEKQNDEKWLEHYNRNGQEKGMSFYETK